MNKDTDRMASKAERVSALADGDLHGAAFGECLDWLCQDEQARADWQAYHIIGDVLRSRDLAVNAGDTAFVTRFRARLLAEGEMVTRPEAATVAVLPAAIHESEAANDGVFRWKLVAGLASVAAVAAIGWSVMGLPGAGGVTQAGSQLAATRAPASAPVQALLSTVPVASGAVEGGAAMLRDPSLDAYLAAHREFAGTSALEGAGSFMRSASFERSAR